LADKDLVINALAIVGSKPSITHIIRGYLLRPAGINGETDFLGHGLLEIYLNYHLSLYQDIYDSTVAALDALEFPKKTQPPLVNEGVDPDSFDYINECKDIAFPQNVALYDKVIRATIDLYRHLPKDEICKYIAQNLPDANGGTIDTSGPTNTGNSTASGGTDTATPPDASSFDYKAECSDIDFPDPIPSDLEAQINDKISGADSLVAGIVCPIIQGIVQAYNLQNGGGITGGGSIGIP